MEYLIWSVEHHAWWAPSEMGYVQDHQMAGRYTGEEVDRILPQANRVGFNECAIPIDQLGLVPVLTRSHSATENAG